jgi:predicted metal-dependent phosphoesterase TrpH
MAHNIDLHCHSLASPDGSLQEKDIARAFEAGILNSVAITDHDRVEEALRLHKIFGDAVIVGEEITTYEGEIIGLYLQERIQPGLTAFDTAQEIKSQGGLVYIPHPFEKVRKGLSETALNAIADKVDIIEVINGRSFSSKARTQARQWAAKNAIASAASSDAHGRVGWGRVYSVLPENPTKETLVSLLRAGSLHGSSNGLASYGYPKLNRFRKRLKDK